MLKNVVWALRCVRKSLSTRICDPNGKQSRECKASGALKDCTVVVMSKARMSTSVQMHCSCQTSWTPSWFLYSTQHSCSLSLPFIFWWMCIQWTRRPMHILLRTCQHLRVTHSTHFSSCTISSALPKHQAMSFNLRNLQHPAVTITHLKHFVELSWNAFQSQRLRFLPGLNSVQADWHDVTSSLAS